MRGALAGAVATIPMTAALLVAEKAGLMGEFPPKHITYSLLRLAGVRRISSKARNTAAMGLHFTYGSSVGAVYGWLAHGVRLHVPGIVQGIGFSLAVWAVSYMGWVPALGIMRSDLRRGKDWKWSNVASHIVYGTALGALSGTTRRKPQNRHRARNR